MVDLAGKEKSVHLDSHAVGERFRLLTHLIYSDAIDRDPSLVERAREIVAQRLLSDDAAFSDGMWAVLLERPVDEVRRAITNEGPDNDTLRSGSPFSVLLGISDQKQREDLWRRARTELEHSTTSSIRFAS